MSRDEPDTGGPGESTAVAGTSSAWRRIEWILFAVLFVTYGYFFQGGGWNQNARVNQIRAIVEQGRLSVNDYLVYRTVAEQDGRQGIRRYPLPRGTSLADIGSVANTGDLAKVAGTDRFYPNKPPGTVMLAVPAYFVAHGLERLAGIDGDGWWVINLNHYLATVFSVSLIGALGGVLFLRVSRRLLPDVPAWSHVAAAATVGLGTLMLPFSTMLFDHVEAAVLLLLAFACLLRTADEGAATSAWLPVAAGAAAGAAVVVNYLSVVVVAWLVIYAWTARGSWRQVMWVVMGGVPAALLLAAYHAVCFGSPWAVANTFQNPIFSEQGLVFGAFRWPQAGIAVQLLVGTRRGLFVFSPVLALALAGVVWMVWQGRRRREAALFLSVFATLWLINASFKEWHAGFSVGPRYLVPAIPFLGLGLTAIFARIPRTTGIVSAVSVLLLLGATAIDAQPPPRFPDPLRQYYWPLASRGVLRIETIPLEGPLSVNPIGTYEPWYYTHFPPGSTQARWSSFNLGELVRARSFVSLLPLLLLQAVAGWRITSSLSGFSRLPAKTDR